MEQKEKKYYVEPLTIVIEVTHHGVICNSQGDRDNYIPTNDNPFA